MDPSLIADRPGGKARRESRWVRSPHDARHHPRRAAARRPPFVETFLLPFLRNSALWPVTLAVLGHVVLFLVLMMVRALNGSIVPAMAMLAALAMGSAFVVTEERRRRGKLAEFSVLLAVLWGSSALIAWALRDTGVL